MLGDFLYQLTARDGAQPILEAHIESWSFTASSLSVDADHTVEEGYIWLVSNLFIAGAPGAVTKCISLRAAMLPPGKNMEVQLFQLSADGAAALSRLGNLNVLDSPSNQVQVGDRQFSHMLVPPGWTLRIHGDFSGAANPNTVAGHLMGIRLPRGNVAI